MDIDKDYIDVDGAVKRIGGNRNLYIKLLNQFIDGNHLDELEAAIAAKDFETATRNAHSIKGICANLSLGKLHVAAQMLEKKLKAKEEFAASLAEVRQIYDLTAKQIAIVAQ